MTPPTNNQTATIAPLLINFLTLTTTFTFPPSPSVGVNGLSITSTGSRLLRLGALAVL